MFASGFTNRHAGLLHELDIFKYLLLHLLYRPFSYLWAAREIVDVGCVYRCNLTEIGNSIFHDKSGLIIRCYFLSRTRVGFGVVIAYFTEGVSVETLRRKNISTLSACSILSQKCSR
jgi:hypothetical protein